MDRLPLRSGSAPLTPITTAEPGAGQNHDHHHHEVDRHRCDLDSRCRYEQPLCTQGVEVDAGEDADGCDDAQQHASGTGIGGQVAPEDETRDREGDGGD